MKNKISKLAQIIAGIIIIILCLYFLLYIVLYTTIILGSRTVSVSAIIGAFTFLIYGIFLIVTAFKKEKTLSQEHALIGGLLFVGMPVIIYLTLKNQSLLGSLITIYLFLFGASLLYKFLKQQQGLLNYLKIQGVKIKEDFKKSKSGYIVIILASIMVFFGIKNASGSYITGAIVVLIEILCISWVVIVYIDQLNKLKYYR